MAAHSSKQKNTFFRPQKLNFKKHLKNPCQSRAGHTSTHNSGSATSRSILLQRLNLHYTKLFPTKQFQELVGTLRKTITHFSVALKQSLADSRVLRHLLRNFSKNTNVSASKATQGRIRKGQSEMNIPYRHWVRPFHSRCLQSMHHRT